MRNYLWLLAILFSFQIHAEDKAPDWARELSSRTLPPYGAEVRSVELLREEHATVDPSGKVTTEHKGAVKILRLEGKNDAFAVVNYVRGLKKIKEFHAWLIAPNGWVKTYGKESVIDVAAQANFELYDEERVRVIEAKNPEVGSTFAWSAEWEEMPLVPQDRWSFQKREPVLMSRYSLTVPTGWQVTTTTLNHAALPPQVDGSTYSWELRDLPFIRKEPRSPNLDTLAPAIGVAYGNSSGQNGAKNVTSWSGLSAWFSSLEDTQAQTNDVLTAKVRELTAGSRSEYERIQVIGKYVQSIKYVAIEMNLSRGGGYQPHPATDVFAKQYGDCKDKANLMKTMLRVAGMDSYLVSIYSGDRNHVQPGWPSPYQFNHAIIAVKLTGDVPSKAVIAHPAIGRLLFFDPTDGSTPVGDLPLDEQGSYALLDANDKGDLVQMPVMPPDTNRTDLQIASALSEKGELDATLTQQISGQQAAEVRRLYKHVQVNEFQKQLEQWIAETAKGINLTKVDANDEFDKGRFGLSLNFNAPAYGQLMQGRLLVFRPAVVHRWNGFVEQTEKRTTPVVLDAECYHAQVRVKLPPNFKVDEMPEDAKLNAPFGTYSAAYKITDNELLFTEELDVSAQTIAADHYSEVKDFFERVAGAEQTPLVLVKN